MRHPVEGSQAPACERGEWVWISVPAPTLPLDLGFLGCALWAGTGSAPGAHRAGAMGGVGLGDAAVLGLPRRLARGLVLSEAPLEATWCQSN